MISVIMPVYNTAPFLADAIQSILNQTYDHFELIIINDGSTDNTEEIINSFQDQRIRYTPNPGNQGIVYSLNRGLSMAKGRWIARMDGDDISRPHRFKLQVQYLESHPEADLVASTVDFIDAHGQPAGIWKEDREHITPKAIRRYLPVSNCIAHPSVMARSESMLRFRYRQEQIFSEDYDLWLRMSAAGMQLHKLEEPLLQYRIVQHSLTRSTQRNVYFKQARTKWRFVSHQLSEGQVNSFTGITSLTMAVDFCGGIIKELIRPFTSK